MSPCPQTRQTGGTTRPHTSNLVLYNGRQRHMADIESLKQRLLNLGVSLAGPPSPGPPRPGAGAAAASSSASAAGGHQAGTSGAQQGRPPSPRGQVCGAGDVGGVGGVGALHAPPATTSTTTSHPAWRPTSSYSAVASCHSCPLGPLQSSIPCPNIHPPFPPPAMLPVGVAGPRARCSPARRSRTHGWTGEWGVPRVVRVRSRGCLA